MRTFTNPILPGFSPDPSICRSGDDFYIVASSFEYFPGVPIFHSRDLVHWRQIGHVLDRPSQLPLDGVFSSGGIFAPTIRYANGRFYMITTNTQIGCFYVWSERPEGPWSEPIPVRTSCIDPSLFFDEDGTVYFTSQSNDGIQQFTIDIETGELTSERALLWSGKEGKYPEAPHLYRIGGMYYLMLAEGGTELGHMESIARSDSPWGPFEPCPSNPILTHRHRTYDDPIQTVGHADLVEAPDGSWWAVLLGIRPVPSYPVVHHLGRETFLAPVAWENGWPIVGDLGRVCIEMKAPSLPSSPWPAPPERDNFESLGFEWLFRGNPVPSSWSVGSDGLTLRATGKTLDDPTGAAWVGRRQRHFDVRVSTLVDTRGEAGLCVLIDERHHYSVVVVPGRKVQVRRRVADLFATVAEASIPEGPVQLVIQANAKTYRLGFVQEAEPHWLAEGTTRLLSTEVAGGFTGVMFGLFALAGEAKFSWFVYKPL
ncbi:glycoside hydrolase family 43 protein [Fimbriimonas ginsengisoli]|uniref:Xylan 1,4-beta-xylosidase n=1 Tax=Fimbriimonas ginsengisoli Gsoil 348 TaxID=661478 RepID=A0A068NQP3_FIMGI|nr:glycoside hydrolase family 43 protein [Fimbriimonas ginsengisoli]AIE85692.1 Xylan 1,4-beta-xylosidase [Fimbriimonas ginsengisoli Gsoil 348]